MHKILPLLTDPASHGGDALDSFDVVVPSMPGYGFSDKPGERGMSVLKVADVWARLMTENLEYPRFGAQGGDWGAGVTARLGVRISERGHWHSRDFRVRRDNGPIPGPRLPAVVAGGTSDVGPA